MKQKDRLVVSYPVFLFIYHYMHSIAAIVMTATKIRNNKLS